MGAHCKHGISDDAGKNPTEELGGASPKRPCWSLDKLKAYFSYCKSFRPVMSDDASEVLSQYYQRQRMSDDAHAARTTVRLLQSAIR